MRKWKLVGSERRFCFKVVICKGDWGLEKTLFSTGGVGGVKLVLFCEHFLFLLDVIECGSIMQSWEHLEFWMVKVVLIFEARG